MNRKPDWLYRQSAAIPYLNSDSGIQVVVVTNGKGTDWIYPKGVIERNMSAPESAAKEAMEEAGVLGIVGSKLLDIYSYEKWGGVCEVKVYPLAVSEVLDDWDEIDVRDRRIILADQALDIIKPVQKRGLENLLDHLRAESMPTQSNSNQNPQQPT